MVAEVTRTITGEGNKLDLKHREKFIGNKKYRQTDQKSVGIFYFDSDLKETSYLITLTRMMPSPSRAAASTSPDVSASV